MISSSIIILINVDNLGYVDDQVTLTTIQFSCDRFDFDVIQYNTSAIWYTAKHNEQWRKYLHVFKRPVIIFVGLKPSIGDIRHNRWHFFTKEDVGRVWLAAAVRHATAPAATGPWLAFGSVPTPSRHGLRRPSGVRLVFGSQLNCGCHNCL